MTIETSNTVNNPSKDIISLFLELGKELNLFETVEIVNKKGEKEQRYKNINGISTLTIVVDYLCQPGKEEEKSSFLELVKAHGNEAYKELGSLALKIRNEKDSTKFGQALIKSNEEKLSNDNSVYYPVIPSIVLPNWYNNTNPNNLMHKHFEELLG